MKIIAGILSLSVCVAVIVVWRAHQHAEVALHIGDATFTAFIADEPHEREVGLGGRDSLSPDAAMLFIFPESSRYGIWMKDMKFPIDIVWLDNEKRIVDSKENVTPDTYPEIFYPKTESRYIVELRAGSVQQSHIEVGAWATF